MLDMKFLRENPDLVRENIKKKFQDEKLPLVDEVIELDAKNRAAITEASELRASRNALSKQIGMLMGQAKKDPSKLEEAEKIKATVKANADRLAELEKLEEEYEQKIHKIMLLIPNIIDPSVPIGPDDSCNVEVERFGEPKVPDFEIPYHTQIMESFDGVDMDAAGRVSGAGFYYLLGDIARLHEGVLAYARDFMIDKGFTFCIPPFMIHGNVVEGVMSQNDMDAMMYKIEGEDPYLIGEMASSIVKGYQGGAKAGEPLAKDAILACAKHFAGYSETQGGRDASEADLSHRKLESWFLPPFERVAKEGCGTFMLGYESIEGVPVTFNKWLLSDRLRGAWNYQGTLITDWDNVGRSVWEQKVKPDYVQAAADAVKSGNDLVMTTPKFYEGAIEAVKTGLLDESLIDAAVARILALKFRLGLFEDPRLPDQERINAVIGSEEHQQLNLEVAREAVALLKNNGSLPFNAAGAKRIAVVGPLADDAQTQLGDWAGSSGQINWMPDGHPREMITTVLDGFKQLSPEGCEVVYSRGANIVDLVPDPEGEFYPDGQPRPKIGVSAKLDRALLDEAVENARQSDLIVAVVGDVIQAIGEGCSTATLELLGGQNALIDALSNVARETGKPFVVVLVSSKPQVLPASVIGTNGVIVDETPAEGTSALLWAPSPGMKGGQAIAEIILGETEPSGRLPITFPRHAGQLPVYYNQIRGQHGNRYADLTQNPAFAFGEGLSYTTFEYGEPTVTNVPESGMFAETDTVHAEITLTNTGDRKGTEVVQLYIGDIVTSYSWTDRELKAFQRVELEPGESKTIAFDIPVSDCTIVDSEANRIVEPGEFEVLIGHSSRREDLKRTTFTVA